MAREVAGHARLAGTARSPDRQPAGVTPPRLLGRPLPGSKNFQPINQLSLKLTKFAIVFAEWGSG